ncbi:NAD-dependent epimerase/dehydratase family protein [Lapidilactobacillus bayanensis]|uniref:NAD-dependent epimerase/dehydratase family protein n=1 Tax=Lapidilactobacillus bayanensis TaxID=2485998 RepID=UPI000F79E1C4|nr:NAD-dependent epimerase/dehydratase family protein [Lapidilactobacillus bayanensis]
MLIDHDVYRSDLQQVIDSQKDWSQIDGHSFLIIGASGMIGSYLVDVLMQRNRLTDAGIRIYAMGRSEKHLEDRFLNYIGDVNFNLVVADVTQPLPDDLQVDYIFHGASNTHPRAYATDPIGTIMTNLKGTEQVLEHAAKVKTQRVLFLSSVEIYGENRGDVNKFVEDYSGYLDCNTLRAGYPEGKRVSESLCQAYIAKYGLDVVIPRICRTFGPTMKLDDSKASSQFILKAVHNEDIVLKSEGTQYYSYGYVGDIVSALLFILVNGDNGAAYNIGSEQFDLHLKDLANQLAQMNGQKVVLDLPDATEAAGFSKATTAILDTTKLNQLGWQSIFDLSTALDHTVKILKDELKDNA